MLKIDTPWVTAWQPEFVGTLVFIVTDRTVLLIHKKTGHGAGRVNAPGGKVDPGESVVQCGLREVYEEVGLRIPSATVGLEMRFVEQAGPQWLGFALTANDFVGTPKETREARPFWCPIDDIPYADMWPDDAIWLPKLLAGEFTQPTIGNFLFHNETLLEHSFDYDSPSVWSSFPSA